MSLDDNPFVARSSLPYELPPFDRISESHYRPAFEHGMHQHEAEIEAIASSAESPTFANTVAALERSGQLLERTGAVFFNQAASHTNDTVAEIEAEIAPRLAAHSDALYLNSRLFQRVKALYDSREQLDLDAEDRHLLERYHTDFVRAGAELSSTDQERLRALNEELTTLATRFKENLLADTNASAIVVDDVAELDGLPEDTIAAAAAAARDRGWDGSYVLTLILPTAQPALASLTNRELRRRIFEASVTRGARGDANDNHEIVARIAQLRAVRAQLLGYPNHAAYVIADQTARTTDAVEALLGQLARAAVANARVEETALREVAASEQAANAQAANTQAGSDSARVDLRAWDWQYYSEKVRQVHYELDTAELREYFELERVLRDGVFFAAGRLYGLSFVERHDLPTYHPDVRVFEVFEQDGSPLGLFLTDYYTRDSKRGGAWMNSFVRQSHLVGQRPVMVNNLNIAKPSPGEPTLLTFAEVKTLFHEFGHALHALFSAVRYPRFAATNVPRDFVEYPSQVNEMWILWPEVLANYARHYRTGEPLPDAVVQRLHAARQWGEGFATTEYLAAALLDLAWHQTTATDVTAEVRAFEHDALHKAGVAVPTIPPRYHTTYFQHSFSNGYGGYSAAYYSYIWSEVLDADTVEWFEETGGLRRENGDRFRQHILSRGGSVDAMEAYRDFRGRDPRIEPLLTRRGLDSDQAGSGSA